jgi:molybdopterin molybdotransferase
MPLQSFQLLKRAASPDCSKQIILYFAIITIILSKGKTMAVSITEALDILDQNIEVLSSEIITIEESPGRIAASDHTASFDLPRFDNSAMDGYAVKLADRGSVVKSDKNIYAGDEAHYTLQQGEAIRIMTGAPIPQGCEAIVPIEEVLTDLDHSQSTELSKRDSLQQ